MTTVTCNGSYIKDGKGTMTLLFHNLVVLASTGQTISVSKEEKQRMIFNDEAIPVALDVTEEQLAVLQSGGTVICTPFNRNVRYGEVNVVMKQ